jgi:tetratricopeptide (TPR) repeat protein
MVLTRVAQIAQTFGAPAEALRLHGQALQIRQTLAREEPADSSILAEIAQSWHQIGNVRVDLGQKKPSIDAFREALRIREDLVALEPANRSFRFDLASSYGYVGDWERNYGLRDQASQSYDAALRLRRDLFQTNPSDVIAKFFLAVSYNNRALHERELGGLGKTSKRREHLEKALEWNGEGLKLLVELMGLDSTTLQSQTNNKEAFFSFTDLRWCLACDSYYYRSSILSELGRFPEARSELEKSLTIFDQLIRDCPGHTGIMRDRARTLIDLGMLCSSFDNLNAANDVLKRLLYENPNVMDNRACISSNKAARGELLIRVGRSTAEVNEGRRLLLEARDEQRHLVGEAPENFNYRSDLERTEAALSH